MNLSSINDSYTTTFNEVDFERNTSNQSVAAMNYDNIVFVHCYPALCIDRIITPIWYIVGITGNIMAAVVWLQPRMRRNSSSAIYLSALSINDTLFLLLHPIQELKYAWFQRSVDYPVICESFALVFLVTQYMAPLLVLCFTVDRYLAVCYPFRKKVLCSASRAVKVVAGVGIGCLSVGSIQPYFWTYDATSTACQVRENVQIGGDRSLWSVWTWATEMLIFMVVPLIILAVNLRVIHEIYRIADRSINPMSSRQTGAAATNAMLLSVSFYVIATVLPATIVYTLAVTFPEGSYDLGFARGGLGRSGLESTLRLLLLQENRRRNLFVALRLQLLPLRVDRKEVPRSRSQHSVVPENQTGSGI